jgi:hypothetical protein
MDDEGVVRIFPTPSTMWRTAPLTSLSWNCKTNKDHIAMALVKYLRMRPKRGGIHVALSEPRLPDPSTRDTSKSPERYVSIVFRLVLKHVSIS